MLSEVPNASQNLPTCARCICMPLQELQNKVYICLLVIYLHLNVKLKCPKPDHKQNHTSHIFLHGRIFCKILKLCRPCSSNVMAQRLVRFLSRDGHTYYGDAILPKGVTDIAKARTARIISGDVFTSLTVTDRVADIRLLLSPLARNDIKTVRCLGLNYERHAKEGGMPIPKYPVLFYKPATAVTGPFDPIPVPLIAREVPQIDYECELVVVIGQEARNVDEHKALDYVFGYCVGNDVSQREWQLKRGGSQWSVGKMYDGFAPMGPGIVSSHLIKDPQALKISTAVNGKEV